ncbi:iron reductase domain protein [Sporormia fimetaria CBS 119925]|uniref:Iron reductase domain protein n=1 Tax=Sporormia fimetaria CBS 119925 TaxID=1340428 RepID=A0A6A6VG63_9PLEO|nr:iron reductase domain protein [Sporormia fimetaria CBS 119925]
MERIVFAVLAVLAAFPTLIQAQAATFYLPETETQFSLNVANDTDNGDLFFRFTSPAYSWVSIGFGKSMKDSLMFIMYPSEDGKTVTVSPRLSTSNSEPSFYPDTQLDLLPGTTITSDGMFVVEAVCHYCRVWPNGALDTESTAQPMIYAFGPGRRIMSNDKNAALKRHHKYGRFTMDMLQARGPGGVPGPESKLNGVTLEGGMKKDHDRMNRAHAVVGCLAIFVLWPVNVVLAGFFKKMKFHVAASVLLLVFLLVAYLLGGLTSAEYNRSKSHRTPHQITAYLTLLPLFLTALLPIPPISRLSSFTPRLHTPLVSSTFVLLVLSGGLGLHLAMQSRPIILIYTAVALIVFAFCFLLQTCIRRRGSAHQRSRAGHEDEQGLMGLKARFAGEHRSRSRAESVESCESGTSSGNGKGVFGGGTMPGPQYLLNMHPGVPVHRW